MINYSQYQGPVAEWEEFVRITGYSQGPAPDIPPEQWRSTTNSTRIEAAQETLRSLG